VQAEYTSFPPALKPAPRFPTRAEIVVANGVAGRWPERAVRPAKKKAANRGFFFMPGSNRSRRERAKKTPRLTCIVTGCRQRAD